MGDRCGMSISADSPLDEILNQGPLVPLLRRQYEFPLGINIVQFSIFNFHSSINENRTNHKTQHFYQLGKPPLLTNKFHLNIDNLVHMLQVLCDHILMTNPWGQRR